MAPRLFCTRASTVTVAPRRAPSPPVPRRGCPGSSCPAAHRLPPARGLAAPAPPRPAARRLRPVAALLTLSCPRGHGCLSTGHLSSPHSCPRLVQTPLSPEELWLCPGRSHGFRPLSAGSVFRANPQPCSLLVTHTLTPVHVPLQWGQSSLGRPPHGRRPSPSARPAPLGPPAVPLGEERYGPAPRGRARDPPWL